MAQLFQVYSVRDEKSQAFSVPMCFPSKGVMLRSLAAAVNKKDSDDLWATHPQDFSIYHLGTFNSDDGVLDPKLPELVNVLSDLAE